MLVLNSGLVDQSRNQACTSKPALSALDRRAGTRTTNARPGALSRTMALT